MGKAQPADRPPINQQPFNLHAEQQDGLNMCRAGEYCLMSTTVYAPTFPLSTKNNEVL